VLDPPPPGELKKLTSTCPQEMVRSGTIWPTAQVHLHSPRPKLCNTKVGNQVLDTLAEVWVDGELRISFRNTFSELMMQKWGELVSVVEQVVLTEDADSLIRCYEKSGIYSSHSCYNIISYRGVKPVYIPAIWGIVVPPKIHLFLWLLAYNKLAMVDNLNKKGLKKNTQCCFCGENESISHMFFECVVARVTWEYVRELMGIEIGGDYISIASKWLHKLYLLLFCKAFG
jgi:hypothetical protein